MVAEIAEPKTKPEAAARKRRPFRMPTEPYHWAVRAVLWDGQPHTFGEILGEAAPRIEAGVASRKFLQGSKHYKGASLTVEQEAKLNVFKAVQNGRIRLVKGYLESMMRWGDTVMTPGPRTKATGIMADLYQWMSAPGLHGDPLPPMPPQYHLGEEGDEVAPGVPEFSEERVARLEATIEDSFKSYIILGATLGLIRAEGLFAYGDYRDFDHYAEKRWEMNGRHARQTIRASEVATLLRERGAPVPVNINHAVALMPLFHRPDALFLAWTKARDKAEEVGQRVTKTRIDAEVEAILSPTPPLPPRPAPEPPVKSDLTPEPEEPEVPEPFDPPVEPLPEHLVPGHGRLTVVIEEPLPPSEILTRPSVVIARLMQETAVLIRETASLIEADPMALARTASLRDTLNVYRREVLGLDE